MQDLLALLSISWAFFVVSSVVAFVVYIFDSEGKSYTSAIKPSLIWGISTALVVLCTMLPFLLIKVFT